jgi:nitrite reductase (NADH) small subunit
VTGRIRVELDWPRHNSVRIGDEVYFCLERDGQVYLIRSRCPHRGGPLHLGQIDGGRLRCPWHGNTFRVDRLCDRAVPTVRRDGRLAAYLPAERSAQPTRARQIIFAK